MNEVEINPNDSLAQLKELIRTTPLSEPERQKQYTNIQALKKVCSEWQRLQRENQQLKQQQHGNDK